MRFEQDDFIMRQIEMITVVISRLTGNMGNGTGTTAAQEHGAVYERLMEMMEGDQINEAENLLFDQLETHSASNLKMALDFYSHLNTFDDKRLENAGFSREEIKSGLDDVMKEYGITNL